MKATKTKKPNVGVSIPVRRRKQKSTTTADAKIKSPIVTSPTCVFSMARKMLTSQHGLSPRPSVTPHGMKGPPPSAVFSLPDVSEDILEKIKCIISDNKPPPSKPPISKPHPQPSLSKPSPKPSPSKPSPSKPSIKQTPVIDEYLDNDLDALPPTLNDLPITPVNTITVASPSVFRSDISETPSDDIAAEKKSPTQSPHCPPPTQEDHVLRLSQKAVVVSTITAEKNATQLPEHQQPDKSHLVKDWKKMGIGGGDSVSDVGGNSQTSAITPEKIIFSTSHGDMFAIMSTGFGDKFLAYYPSDLTSLDSTVEKYANVTTILSKTHIISNGEDASALGVTRICEKGGIAAGHIRPEIQECEGLIGVGILSDTDVFQTKLCSVIFRDRKGENVTFVIMTAEDSPSKGTDTESSENEDSASMVSGAGTYSIPNSKVSQYPIIHAAVLENNLAAGKPQNIIQLVHSITSVIRDKSVVDMRAEAMGAVEDARREVSDRLNAFLRKSEKACEVRDESETMISNAMTTSIEMSDIVSYEDLSARFKAHRLYAERVSDSVSRVSQAVISGLDEISCKIAKEMAKLYIDTRMTISPDVDMDFLKAEGWGYDGVIDTAVFGNIGPNGGLVDDEGNRIVAADYEHPELVKAAIESADVKID